MKITIQIAALALGAMLASFVPVKHSGSSAPVVKTISGKSSIKWKQLEIDLGEVNHNKPVTLEFEFVNTGSEAVVISAVQAGCGCTATNYSKEPVAPGATAKIGATYNAATKGVFKKTVTVTTNAEETPRVLTFKGIVI